jgi:peptidoglycan/LPS O-acetylase OafA/YrhL
MNIRKPGEHIPWLDGWRGIAIALVLIEHFAGVPTGHLGVQVFFVLSGLLISQILFEQRVPLRTFYRRRAARILPVFYLYVFVMACAGALILPAVDWSSVAATAVFLRSYFGGHIWEDPLAFGNLWSLNVEEHAYVFLSVLALIAASRGERAARWLLSIATIVPLACVVYFHAFPERPGITPFHLRTEGAIFPLLASSSIFLWRRVRPIDVSPSAASAILFATILVATLDTMGVAHGGTMIKSVLLPLLLALSVNVLDRAPLLVRNFLSLRWMTWLGTCSFSLYLWHYPFFTLINHGAWPFGRVAAVLCALAIGTASFYWVEKPLRSLLRGAQPKVPNAAAPAPAT